MSFDIIKNNHTRLETSVSMIVGIAMMMEFIDSTALNTSLPQIAHSFLINPMALKIVLSGYLLSLGLFTPLSGYYCDRYGAKKIFISAMIVFMASSIGCGLSKNIIQMVIARICQGIGAAFLLPTARIMTMKIYGRNRMKIGIARNIFTISLGMALGPLVGGGLTTFTSWRFIFLINIPFGFISLLGAIIFLPDLNEAAHSDRLDITGFLLFGLSIISLLFYLNAFVNNQSGHIEKTISLLCCLTGIIGYSVHNKKNHQPLFDPSLWTNRNFMIAASGNLILKLALASPLFLVPMMLQGVFGLSACQSGCLMLFNALGFIFSRHISTRLSERLSPLQLMIAYSLLLSIVLASFSRNMLFFSFPLIATELFIYGIVVSLLVPQMCSITYTQLDDNKMSQGVCLLSSLGQVSTSLCITLAAGLIGLIDGHHHLSTNIMSKHALIFTFLIESIFPIIALYFFVNIMKVNLTIANQIN